MEKPSESPASTPFLPWSQCFDFHRAIDEGDRVSMSAGARQYLQSITDTAPQRIKRHAVGEILFRAQRGTEWEPVDALMPDGNEVRIGKRPAPYSKDRMVPPAGRAKEGRVNHKGQRVLYCGGSRETAVAEIRPWVGSLVSIAEFKVLRPLSIVHCEPDPDDAFRKVFDAYEHSLYLAPRPEPELAERCAWERINRMFAEPVTATDDTAEYLKTQVVAEVIRKLGVDGLAFRSTVDVGGTCYALFDPGLVACEEVYIVRVQSVKCEFNEYCPGSHPLPSIIVN